MVVGDITTGADLVVIGAGPGGYTAAIRGAQKGLDVVLVEKEKVGGVCLNHGCIPSKAIIHAADTAALIEEADEYGVEAGDVSVDMEKLQDWKTDVVATLTDGVSMLEEKHDVTVLQGRAAFRDSSTLHVTGDDAGKTLSFEQCVIATGSSPRSLPDVPFDGETIINSRQALQLAEVPDRFVVVGGGYIGMELGIAYAKLGADVTILEAGERILPNQDAEAAQAVADASEEYGIDIRTGTTVEQIDVEDGRATVSFEGEEVDGDKVLVAIGRTPHTESLDLDKTGVSTDEKGFVKVDGSFRTGAPHVYAIGDVADQPMLAHKASKQAKIVADAIGGEGGMKDYQAIPECVYTDPEIAEVGLSEGEAKEKGYDVVTGRSPLSANGRALTRDETAGFVKLVATKQDNVLLGATICGPDASELISELAFAIEMGALANDLALTIHPHPTLTEAVQEAAEDVVATATHTYQG